MFNLHVALIWHEISLTTMSRSFKMLLDVAVIFKFVMILDVMHLEI